MKRILKAQVIFSIIAVAVLLMAAETRHITQMSDTKANLILYLDKGQIAMTTDTVSGTGSDLLCMLDMDSTFRMIPLLGRNAWFKTAICTTLIVVGTQTFTDNVTYFIDNETDSMRRAQFNCAAIDESTTRTFSFPDVSGTFALLNTNNVFTGVDTFANDVHLHKTTADSLAATTVRATTDTAATGKYGILYFNGFLSTAASASRLYSPAGDMIFGWNGITSNNNITMDAGSPGLFTVNTDSFRLYCADGYYYFKASPKVCYIDSVLQLAACAAPPATLADGMIWWTNAGNDTLYMRLNSKTVKIITGD